MENISIYGILRILLFFLSTPKPERDCDLSVRKKNSKQ
ncbi:hypothetical protein J729_4642, partial [Acinetobacter baumannii 929679-598]